MLILLRPAFVLAAFVLASLPFCGGDNDRDSEERQALAAAAQAQGDDPGERIPIGESYPCTIFPGPAGEGLVEPVAGSCRWDLEKQGNLWIARFRETWRCDDFAAEYPGHPSCDRLTGFHEWTYQVDLVRGQVRLIDDRGQFAPGMLE